MGSSIIRADLIDKTNTVDDQYTLVTDRCERTYSKHFDDAFSFVQKTSKFVFDCKLSEVYRV